MQFKILFLIFAVFSAANALTACTGEDDGESATCIADDEEHPICTSELCECAHDSCSTYSALPSCNPTTGACEVEGATQMIAGLAALFALLTLY